MLGLISAIMPSVMEVAGRFLPEDKEKRAAAEREIQAKLTDRNTCMIGAGTDWQIITPKRGAEG